MGQLELANVPVKGWIIDHDVHGFPYSPSDAVHLRAHYGDVVHTDVVTRDVTMIIYGEGALRCSLSLSLKVHADPSMYSSSHSSWSHLYLHSQGPLADS